MNLKLHQFQFFFSLRLFSWLPSFFLLSFKLSVHRWLFSALLVKSFFSFTFSLAASPLTPSSITTALSSNCTKLFCLFPSPLTARLEPCPLCPCSTEEVFLSELFLTSCGTGRRLGEVSPLRLMLARCWVLESPLTAR